MLIWSTDILHLNNSIDLVLTSSDTLQARQRSLAASGELVSKDSYSTWTEYSTLPQIDPDAIIPVRDKENII